MQKRFSVQAFEDWLPRLPAAERMHAEPSTVGGTVSEGIANRVYSSCASHYR
jgi:hypothetical protein